MNWKEENIVFKRQFSNVMAKIRGGEVEVQAEHIEITKLLIFNTSGKLFR